MKTIILNNTEYNILKIFPKSSQSECFLIENDSGLKVLKLYRNEKNVKPKIKISEIRNIKKHENILYVFEFGFYNSSFYEITEYCPGETLLEKIPITSIDDLKTIIYHINEALYYCHSNGFLFLDIKPGNIFLKNKNFDSLVFGDFGSSDFFNIKSKYLISELCKYWYSPPETHSKFHGLSLLESSFDYYTLGIMIIELINGDNQLKYFDNSTLLQLKLEQKFDLSKITDLRLKTIILNLLKTKPSQRWLYEEVKNWCLDMTYNFEKPEQKEKKKLKHLKKEAIKKKNREIIEIEKNFNDQYCFSKDAIQKKMISDEKNLRISKIKQEIFEIEYN